MYIKKLVILVGVILIVGLLLPACVPGALQDSIRATSADVKALKGDVDKLGKKVDEMDKYVRDPEITMAERDIKEHVVRGRADFIAYQDEYAKTAKTITSLNKALLGTPAKVDKNTGKVLEAAKPGPVQNIETKLDRLIGIPAKPAVAEKKDPVTEVIITKASKAVPAKPGIMDAVTEKLDKLVGISGKPGVPAVAEKKDPNTGKVITKAVKAVPAVPATPGLLDAVVEKLDKLVGVTGKPEVPAVPEKKDPNTGKVITKAVPAIPAVPAVPGVIDDIKKDLADIKARLDSIEKSLAVK